MPAHLTLLDMIILIRLGEEDQSRSIIRIIKSRRMRWAGHEGEEERV
jgi:hypothetical protein